MLKKTAGRERWNDNDDDDDDDDNDDGRLRTTTTMAMAIDRAGPLFRNRWSTGF